MHSILLHRVGIGMAVTITCDAMPGRTWKGVVEKLPTRVVPLGTRSLGEVSCVIQNPNRDLLPGPNIVWRPVQIGVSSLTKAQATAGPVRRRCGCVADG